MIELLASGIIGAALLWLVLQPIVAPSAAPAVDIDPVDPEETPRGQALLALKEIEFDRATGKLSDTDYTALKAKYSAAAIAALEVPQRRFCSNCGVALPAGALFCAQCGERVSR
jgi:hypothetical protein